MRPRDGRYGCWAGNPQGYPEDPRCCVEEVSEGGRSLRFHQCNRLRGFGPDKLWCKQHNPERVKAKREEREKAHEERTAKNKRIETEGRKLLQRLGVSGHCEFNVRSLDWTENLVITFEDAKRLLNELKR